MAHDRWRVFRPGFGDAGFRFSESRLRTRNPVETAEIAGFRPSTAGFCRCKPIPGKTEEMVEFEPKGSEFRD